ncbi:hypothetical protein BJV77DRAFT_1041209 [Russula vinacea]|nr:hypothetical protein BJV77DRAFT_1041209 [Russula vinacea]
MSIFSRTSLIIIAIAIPVLAIRDPGYYYYPSYYPPNNPYDQDRSPDRSDHSGGAKLNLLKPTYAPPDYAPPVYHHAAAYPTPTYFPPTVPTIPIQPPVVGPDQPHNLLADTPADNLPAYSQAYEPPADDQAHEQPAYEQAHRLPVYNHAYRPPVDTAPLVENPVSDLPNPLTTPTETPSNPPAEETAADTLENGLAFDVPTPSEQGHGKPSPLPHTMDRRNAPRVSRQKIGKAVKGTIPGERHARRFQFLKKRQQAEQRTIVPVTVNMITGVGPAPSTSSAPTTTVTNSLPPIQPHIAPGIKVDNSQAALSPHGNPEATTPSGGELTPPASSYKGGQQSANLITGEPRNKAIVIVSVLSIMLGLVVIITIVKLTGNAMRKRKHAVGFGRYDEHLSSKEGLIPEMSDQAHFETHDVIITRPDGSEISPLSSGRSDSPSPPPFRGHGISPPPLPMPAFAPPPAPAGPLSMSFMKLLSPTANLAQQNLAESRASTTSETMSVSTTSTNMSDGEQRPASDDENLGRQVSHRRMRSAPGSVVWSARSSSATGKLTSGLSGEEGYWESSVGRMGCRSSRGRSVAMSVMW